MSAQRAAVSRRSKHPAICRSIYVPIQVWAVIVVGCFWFLMVLVYKDKTLLHNFICIAASVKVVVFFVAELVFKRQHYLSLRGCAQGITFSPCLIICPVDCPVPI